MLQLSWNFVCQLVTMYIVHKQKGKLLACLVTSELLLSELCLSRVWSGCKLFKPFKPIVFHWKITPSLTSLALGVIFQETLGSLWFKSYLTHGYHKFLLFEQCIIFNEPTTGLTIDLGIEAVALCLPMTMNVKGSVITVLIKFHCYISIFQTPINPKVIDFR